jgi:hypothetical protein
VGAGAAGVGDDGIAAGFCDGAGAACFAAGLAAGFVSPFAPSPAPSRGKVSLILRTTGGSMVDDADRTNSPWLFKCASRVLLSTPSSFASS